MVCVNESLARGLCARLAQESEDAVSAGFRHLFSIKRHEIRGSHRTAKGRRRIHSTLSKSIGRSAFLKTEEPIGDRYGIWAHWAQDHSCSQPTLQPVQMLYDMETGARLSPKIPFYMTSHAIGRSFQRNRTTDVSVVQSEMNAAALWGLLIGFYGTAMPERIGLALGDRRPFMIPAKKGAFLGDIEYLASGDCKAVVRTYIGGGEAMTEAKQDLFNALKAWQVATGPDSMLEAVLVASVEMLRAKCLFGKDKVEVPERLVKYAHGYFAILDEYDYVIRPLDERNDRASREKLVWNWAKLQASTSCVADV